MTLDQCVGLDDRFGVGRAFIRPSPCAAPSPKPKPHTGREPVPPGGARPESSPLPTRSHRPTLKSTHAWTGGVQAPPPIGRHARGRTFAELPEEFIVKTPGRRSEGSRALRCFDTRWPLPAPDCRNQPWYVVQYVVGVSQPGTQVFTARQTLSPTAQLTSVAQKRIAKPWLCPLRG